MPPGLSVCLGLFLSHVPTLRWFFAPPQKKNLSAKKKKKDNEN